MRILLLGVLLLSACVPVVGAEPLQPPFGLSWGDSPNRLVDWAVRMKLDQTVKAPADEPRLKILLVSPAKGSLPGHDASTLEARFMDGKLFEVALHYSYPGKGAPFVRAQFVELKKILTRRHGGFKPGGQKRETPIEGVTTRSTAFQIDPAPARYLMLILTEAMDTKRGDASARFTVIYHNGGLLKEDSETVIIRRDGVDPPTKQP